jgi:hypothetical protein
VTGHLCTDISREFLAKTCVSTVVICDVCTLHFCRNQAGAIESIDAEPKLDDTVQYMKQARTQGLRS